MMKGRNTRAKRQRVVLSDESSDEAPHVNTTQTSSKRSRIIDVDSEEEKTPAVGSNAASNTVSVISSDDEGERAPLRPKSNIVRSVGPADKPMKVLKMFDDTKSNKWRKPRSKAPATPRPSATAGGSSTPVASSSATLLTPSLTPTASTTRPSTARPPTSTAGTVAGPSSAVASTNAIPVTIKPADDTKGRKRLEVRVLKPIFKEDDQETLEYWLDTMREEQGDDEEETDNLVENVEWEEFEEAVKDEKVVELDLPPLNPGDDIKSKLLDAMIKGLEVVAGREELQRFWGGELATAEGREVWAERVAGGISRGAAELLTRGNRKMPTPDEFVTKLRSTHDLPYWGVYIKLGIPRKPGLPILIYVGSGTAIAAGLKSRHGSHISLMRNNSVDDVFQKAWRPNPSDYDIVLVEGFGLRGFDHRAATDEELRSAYAVTLCAELILVELFNAHDKFGSAELVFDLSHDYKPCNRADPLQTAPKLIFPARAYPCTWDGCNAVRRSPSELARHMRYHSGERLYPCPICEKCFFKAQTVKEHLSAVHAGILAYECDECPKMFKWPSSLWTHKRTEHGIRRRFACSRCTDLFTSKFARDEHERFVHDGEVREHKYNCNECTYATHNKPQLAIHIVREHERREPPRHFRCKLCNKAFLTQGNLDGHMPSHAPPGFTCAICNESFTYNGDLQRHQGTHEVKPTSVYCPICDAPFTNKLRLGKHLNKVHPGQGPNQHRCRVPNCTSAYASPQARDKHERQCRRKV